VADSTASVYAMSVNEHFMADNASPEEVAIHNFLDILGVAQINVKEQINAEKTTTYTSPRVSAQFLMSKNKSSSPSFMERRARKLQEAQSQSFSNGSTAIKSHKV
jgi:hypothetical protein